LRAKRSNLLELERLLEIAAPLSLLAMTTICFDAITNEARIIEQKAKNPLRPLRLRAFALIQSF
jgi:hypothetical protein